jgi:hypothetical protein
MHRAPVGVLSSSARMAASVPLLLAVAAVSVAVGTGAAPASATATTVCLTNGSAIGQPYTVPAAGVTQVALDVYGQAGQDWIYQQGDSMDPNASSFDLAGGLGSELQATIDVTPGEVLQRGVLPGAIGGISPEFSEDTGSGSVLSFSVGAAGGNGGAAEYVAVVGSGGCQTPLVVAAGGGGAGSGIDGDFENAHGGAGGNADAGSGARGGGDAGSNSQDDGGGGGPASATGGGSAGAHGHSLAVCFNGNDGQAGAFQSGGTGGPGHGGNADCDPGQGAGGGGAGFYYGGGGGSGYNKYPSGGGGGGSSYVMPGIPLAPGTSALQGPSAPGVWSAGGEDGELPATASGGGAIVPDPSVVPLVDTSIALSSSANPVGHGKPVTFTAVVSTPDPAGAIPGGVVDFGGSLGTALVVPQADGTATATLTTSSLADGTTKIAAHYDGSSGNGAAYRTTVDATLDEVVSPAITFTSTPPTDAKPGGATYTVSATDSSGLPVTFSIDPSAVAVCTISGATVSFTGAGMCVIDGDQAASATKPAAVQVQQDVTVTPLPTQAITFTSSPPADAHPGDDYTVSATGGGSGKPVTFSTGDTDPCQYDGSDTNVVQLEGGGVCHITAHQAGGNGYAAAPDVEQDVKIGPVPDVVDFLTTAPTNAVPGGNYTISALAQEFDPVTLSLGARSTGCTFAVFGSDQFIRSALVTFTATGTCVIDASAAGALPRTGPSTSEQDIVIRQAQAIAFTSSAPAAPTYGGSYSLSATGGDSGDQVTFATSTPAVCTASDATVSFVGVGRCTVTADQAGNAVYQAASTVSQTLTVGQASLTVAAPSASYAYGAALPATFTPTYAGFAPGESVASLDSPATCAPTTPVAGVDSYVISCSGATDADYSIVYAAGTLSITQAPLTVAAPAESYVYGEQVPAGFTPRYDGLAADETVASLTTPATCAATTTPGHVGGYTISCSGAVDPNYAISYESSTLSVTPAPLTLSASSESLVYGANVPATFTPLYTGLVAGDTAASLISPGACSTGMAADAGDYAISCAGAVDPDYSISYAPGRLTITPAPLSVIAPVSSYVYGASAPASFAPTYEGFVAGDTAASLGTPATCSPTTAPAAAGQYAISCSGAADPNYTFTYADAKLTITRAPVTVTGPTASYPYGSPIPASLPAAYDGLADGETMASLGSTASCAPVSPPASAGTYAVPCSGAVDPNYDFTYKSGELTITTVAVTVTPVAETYSYGASVPATVAPAYAGFVAGETAASLASRASCAPTSAVRGVGDYTVACSGAVDPNYSFAYPSGRLTITRAPLSVVAPAEGFVYGAAIPAHFTPTYSGFVAGDTVGSLASRGTCSPSAAVRGAGTYAILCSGVSDPNYVVSYTANTLRIIRAATTVTATSLRTGTRETPGPARFSARLLAAPRGSAVAGQRVSFSIGHTLECAGVTNAHGVASCARPDRSTFAAAVRRRAPLASFAGSRDYLGSSRGVPLLTGR